MSFLRSKKWWNERFVTLMVIPERTRRVHKVVVPFFIVKFAIVSLSLAVVFLVILGLDYVHVLGRIAENKALKGENFKLRQEMQLIRNKVDSMESTVERVRNYAKKLQLLTGQGDKAAGEIPWGGPDESVEARDPASKGEKQLPLPGRDPTSNLKLDERVERLQTVSTVMENGLSKLQSQLWKKSAIIAATPSILPIAGWVSSPFGYRRNPYDGSYKLHAGVDIVADPGTPVRAPADGTVIFSGFREGYGKCVVIEHGYGIRTVFAHNSRLFVNGGARVRRGDFLAEVGSTGHSTGPHLPYEVRQNGVPVNPAMFFTRTRL